MAKVQDGSQAQGQGRQKGQNQENYKIDKAGAREKILVGLRNKTNLHRQTENTGIKTTQGIMRKMGDTWRGVETSTRTGETSGCDSTIKG